MKYRSWLIVPGNSDKQLGMAVGTSADVVVVDLVDTVPDEAKGHARQLGAEWLAAHRTNLLEQRRLGRWVRINPPGSGHARDDLQAVMPSAPDGIILPRASGPEAVRQLASEIYELEQRHGIPANSTRIMPVAGETPLSAMRIADYLELAHQRLSGLTWSGAGIAASLGCAQARGADGGWNDACRFVRAQTLLTAHASQLMVIDAPFEGLGDKKAMARAARSARADGFVGMFAIHSDQVGAINAAFAPSSEQLEEAREIVSAFEASSHGGSLPFRGRMVDRSHLSQAQRVIDLAEAEAAAAEARRKPILRPA